MTKKFRRIIFFVFTAFFAAGSFVAVFYAEGYRFDLPLFKIEKVGGIFIKTSVDGAKIYINDKYISSTGGILTYSALISDLVPKNYSVFIYKENYYPWNKTIRVESGMVANLDKIILFPLELKQTKIAALPASQKISEFDINGDSGAVEIKVAAGKIDNIFVYNPADGKFVSSGKIKKATSPSTILSPDKNKNLYVSDGKIFVEYLNDTDEKPVKKAGTKELIADAGAPVEFYEWLGDSEHIIWFSDGEISVAELNNGGGKRNSVKFYLGIDPPFFWNRANSELYYFKKESGKNALYAVDFRS